MVPAIQPRVSRLTLFQRTPPWVAPHMDHEVTPRMREAYRRLPALQQLSRAFIYSLVELLLAPGMTRDTAPPEAGGVDREAQAAPRGPGPGACGGY